METLEYVKKLEEAARNDRTMPVFDPKQGRFSGWATDELLLEIEADVLRGQKDPLRFSVICWFARRDLEESQGVEPAVLVTLAIGELNGKRRLTPVTAKLEKLVSDLIDKIRGKIENLPADTRRQRCQQFLFYQHAIFLDACGRFDDAAEIQVQAALLAGELGDAVSAGISRFVALTHKAKYAFCLGEPIGINQAVKAVIDEVPALQNAVANTPLAVQWGIGNAYAHVLLELVWQDFYWGTEWNRFATKFFDKKALIEPQFNDYVELVDVVNSLSCSSGEQGAELRLIRLSVREPLEVNATARLVLMRRAMAQGDNEQAGHHYSQISQAGAVRHIRAIAEFELAGLAGYSGA